MIEIPLKNPKPDFDLMASVLKGEKKIDKVLSAELLIDEEIKKTIVEKYFGQENIPPPTAQRFGANKEDARFRDTEVYREAYKNYHKSLINLYYRLGYHFVPDLEFYLNFSSLNTVSRISKDNAIYSRGERYWAEEGFGIIRSWEDFEKFPWGKVDSLLGEYEEHLIFLGKNLPDGMKIASMAALYEPIMEWLFGYEGLFYLSYDDPELVSAVFEKLGNLIYKSYIIAAQMDGVGVIWHGDDLGFKTGTMLSPDFLRKWVFPWFKKYSDIAHKYNKSFWYHCCGNKTEIMSDLIDYVKIDALHAFEDSCCSIIDYKKKYGDRVGLIGGADIDKMARLNKNDLRKYLENILENCFSGGRYIFGTGNSICNFIPLENYFTLLDISQNWSG